MQRSRDQEDDQRRRQSTIRRLCSLGPQWRRQRKRAWKRKGQRQRRGRFARSCATHPAIPQRSSDLGVRNRRVSRQAFERAVQHRQWLPEVRRHHLHNAVRHQPGLCQSLGEGGRSGRCSCCRQATQGCHQACRCTQVCSRQACRQACCQVSCKTRCQAGACSRTKRERRRAARGPAKEGPLGASQAPRRCMPAKRRAHDLHPARPGQRQRGRRRYVRGRRRGRHGSGRARRSAHRQRSPPQEPTRSSRRNAGRWPRRRRFAQAESRLLSSQSRRFRNSPRASLPPSSQT